jgi:hypothetical protein
LRIDLMSRPLLIGLVTGLVFGCVDLVFTWLNPVEDDTLIALLRFYGPMFLVWSAVAFTAARRSGRWRSGVAAGAVAAFATFAVFIVLNFVRVNVFLHDLTARPDWQSLMARFQASGGGNLRLFVNLDYLRGTPFKITAATAIGVVLGGLGGTFGWLMRTRAS